MKPDLVSVVTARVVFFVLSHALKYQKYFKNTGPGCSKAGY